MYQCYFRRQQGLYLSITAALRAVAGLETAQNRLRASNEL